MNHAEKELLVSSDARRAFLTCGLRAQPRSPSTSTDPNSHMRPADYQRHSPWHSIYTLEPPFGTINEGVLEIDDLLNEPDFRVTSDKQLSELGRSLLPDCGGYSGWRQQLDGCRGTRAARRRVGFPAQGVDSCSVRWRSGFPRIAGPPVLSSGCWVHDGFHMLSGLSDAPTLPARCRCQASGAALHLEW